MVTMLKAAIVRLLPSEVLDPGRLTLVVGDRRRRVAALDAGCAAMRTGRISRKEIGRPVDDPWLLTWLNRQRYNP